MVTRNTLDEGLVDEMEAYKKEVRGLRRCNEIIRRWGWWGEERGRGGRKGERVYNIKSEW